MKRIFYTILFVVAAVALPVFALAQSYNASDTITLPPNFIDLIWSQASLVFNSLQTYTGMIVGVLLALVVIGEVIMLLRHPNK